MEPLPLPIALFACYLIRRMNRKLKNHKGMPHAVQITTEFACSIMNCIGCTNSASREVTPYIEVIPEAVLVHRH